MDESMYKQSQNQKARDSYDEWKLIINKEMNKTKTERPCE